MNLTEELEKVATELQRGMSNAVSDDAYLKLHDAYIRTVELLARINRYISR